MGPTEARLFARHGKGGLRIAQLTRLVFNVHHTDRAMFPAEARPLARHGESGLHIAQLTRLVVDVHHTDLAMIRTEARPLARKGKVGLPMAQLTFSRHRTKMSELQEYDEDLNIYQFTKS
jgi:hypothetical protein